MSASLRLTLLSLLVAWSCQSAPAEEPAAEADGLAAPAVHELSSNSGDYRIEYTAYPDPIPLNEPFELVVRVLGPDGAPAPNVELLVDAAMPAHRHGMNTAAKVEPLEDGRFRVQGMLLHMSGHWELYFDVSQGGATDRAQFDLRF